MTCSLGVPNAGGALPACEPVRSLVNPARCVLLGVRGSLAFGVCFPGSVWVEPDHGYAPSAEAPPGPHALGTDADVPSERGTPCAHHGTAGWLLEPPRPWRPEASRVAARAAASHGGAGGAAAPRGRHRARRDFRGLRGGAQGAPRRPPEPVRRGCVQPAAGDEAEEAARAARPAAHCD